MQQAVLRLHALVQPRAGIRGQDVEGTGFDALFHRPVHRAPEHALVIGVHAEYETPVDHDPGIVYAPDRGHVVPIEILNLGVLAQIAVAQGFESHEDTAQARLGRGLQQARFQNRIHRGRGLPQPPHALHPGKQRRGETRMPEQVIVEKIEMPAGQPSDLGQGVVHRPGVK